MHLSLGWLRDGWGPKTCNTHVHAFSLGFPLLGSNEVANVLHA